MGAGRFSSLEFDEGGPGAGRGRPARPGEAARGRFPAAVRDAAYYLGRAEEQELAGEHDKALRSYSAALGENPLLLEAWVGQLLMLLEMDEYPEARLWADKALEKFPDNPQLLAAKSVALFRMGLVTEARDLNDAALAGRGESEVVWLCRGELMVADDRSAGEECFRRSVELSGRKGLARLRVGAACYRHGRWGEALATLGEAAASLPKSAKLWHLMGLTQDALGLASQARKSHGLAVSLNPANARYRAAAAGPKRSLGSAVARFLGRLFRR